MYLSESISLSITVAFTACKYRQFRLCLQSFVLNDLVSDVPGGNLDYISGLRGAGTEFGLQFGDFLIWDNFYHGVLLFQMLAVVSVSNRSHVC